MRIPPNQLLMNSFNITVPVESKPSNFEKKFGFVKSQFQTWWKNWYDKVFEHLISFDKWIHRDPTSILTTPSSYDKKCSESEYRMTRLPRMAW